MTQTFRQKKGDRLIHPGVSATELRCDYAVAPLDRAAVEMDRKWGIDRLPEFVSPATAEKYGRAIAHLNAMLDAVDPERTAAAAANCIKGLAAMDAEATALGHKPITPDVWFFGDGPTRFGVIRETCDWRAAEAVAGGVRLYSMQHVANALAAYESALPVIEAGHAAKPAPWVSPLSAELDDLIPF